MAENKKSFVLYADLLKSIEHLTNEEKGILFNHLLLYVNDKNPTLDDRLILTAWKPIELQLKRDLKKFEDVKAKRSEAGKRSAELRNQKNNEQGSTKSTSVKSVKQGSTNSTDNDNDNDNDNESVINKKDFSLPIENPNLNTYTIKDLSNYLLYDEIQKDRFQMMYKNNDFKKTIENFYEHKLKTSSLHDSYINFTKHFFSWVNSKNK